MLKAQIKLNKNFSISVDDLIPVTLSERENFLASLYFSPACAESKVEGMQIISVHCYMVLSGWLFLSPPA